MKGAMVKRLIVSLKCPVCLLIREVRKDGAGSLCRSCRAKKNAKSKIGKYIDMIGFVSGRLTVIGVSHQIRKQYLWKCECKCGAEIIVSGYNLRSGKTQSCGCIVKTQNGLSTTSTYRSWDSMIQRCYDTKSKPYQRYGAKGIVVCERWKNSFLNFLDDMGERPQGTSLDRIDSFGNYEKSNCRWATNKQQSRNRKSNHILEVFGKKQTLVDWSEQTGIQWNTILKRIILGWNVEKALTEKVTKCQSRELKNKK